MFRITHGQSYSTQEANTNQAESFFSRIRRAEIGTHHRMVGSYLFAYAREMSWRENHRRESNGAIPDGRTGGVAAPGFQGLEGLLAEEHVMNDPHVVTGLIAKRAELAGKIDHHQAMLRQLMIDLDAIDTALRLFKPDIELNEIKPKPMPPMHVAYKGEVARIVLGTVRNAKRP